MIQPEPPPQPNDHPHVWPSAIAWATTRGASSTALDLMRKRHEQGVAKYGAALQPHNGRDPLIDLVQELLDAVAYSMQALLETPPETSRRAVLRDVMARSWQSLETILCTIDDPNALGPDPNAAPPLRNMDRAQLQTLGRVATHEAFVEAMGE